jgi:hypothetical protein
MDVIQIYRNAIKFFERHKFSIFTEHKRYLKHARRDLARLYPTKQDEERLEPFSDLILSLLLLDLLPLRPQLQAFYHPKPRGAPPRDPIQMFRSLLCMILSGQTLSFTKWVKLLHSQPLFAVLSSFENGSPGVGAFYELTAASSPFDLPIFILPVQAKVRDSVNGVKALDRALKLYPELFFASFISVSVHDNCPTYDFLGARSITPFIAHNKQHTG